MEDINLPFNPDSDKQKFLVNESSNSELSIQESELIGIGQEKVALGPTGLIVNRSKGSDYNHENLSEEMGRFRKDPFGYMRKLSEETSAFYQGKGWRGYEDYIGANLFTKDMTPIFKSKVMSSNNVLNIINELSKEAVVQFEQNQTVPSNLTKYLSPRLMKSILKLNDHEERVNKVKLILLNKAKVVVEGLAANLSSKSMIKVYGFTLNILFTRMYHQGIYINENELAKVRVAAQTAQKNNIPLLVLPCHKSHIDYLVVSYVFLRLGLSLPYIAAGDNLNLPILGSILRKGGAFFIRRNWNKDPLYLELVKEYILTVLSSGYNMECYIEGTRSRTGKLLNPKFGILNIILQGLLDNKIKDCIVMPISIGYDRVIETSSYADELLGTPKQSESLWSLLSSSKVAQLKWGRVDIRFANPFSLKEFTSNKTLNENDVDSKQLIRALGYRVMSDINSASVVMPTALVGTVLLTLRGRGVGWSELVRRVEWLRGQIEGKGGKVAHFMGMEVGDVVKRAINIIKDLVGTRPGLIEPVYFAINRFQLSYYRNQVIHIFISEALVSVAMYTLIKKGGNHSDQTMSYDKLLSNVTFLSKLLKNDFVYPQNSINDNLDLTLKFLENTTVITQSDNKITLHPTERSTGRENYDFYCFLLWPFIESYWLASITLFSLKPNLKINQFDLLNRIQQLGKTLYYQGDLSYLEAINKETVLNAILQLINCNVLIQLDQNDLILHDEFENHNIHQNLWNRVDEIGTFRREGKNRRDNATVSSRVLRLAELVGQNTTTTTTTTTSTASTIPKL